MTSKRTLRSRVVSNMYWTLQVTSKRSLRSQVVIHWTTQVTSTKRDHWGHEWCSICIGHYKWPQRSHRGRECTLQLTSKRLGHELCPIYIGHYKWPQLGHWGHEWCPISIGPKWWLNFFRFWTFGQKTTFGTVWESRSLQWKLDIPEFAMGNRTRPSFFSNSLFILAWKFKFLLVLIRNL